MNYAIKKENKAHALIRIGIDARFYGPVGKGLGRYTKEIADRILTMDKENEYVIFLSQENFAEFKTDNPRVKKVLAPAHWYTAAEQILMPYYIWREKIDLMHFPHFNVPLFCPVKFIVTIHDLILTKFPTQRATTLSPLLYKLKHFFYRLVINSAVKRSVKIIAVSEFTKNDIIGQFKVAAEKIIVTYEGVASDLKKNSRDEVSSGSNKDEKQEILILGKYKITKPYLLYVGNAYPHKNLERLIKVFGKLNSARFSGGTDNKLKLVLVGKDDYFYSRVKEYAKQFEKSRIIFPGFVPDDELSMLYKNAIAFVFPSLYEGFGLPPLEAMSRGCPVVSSGAASMREILGDAALYFNPEDENDMREKIEMIILNSHKRPSRSSVDLEGLTGQMMTRGFEQVKKYSWDKCAGETLEVYKIINGK